MQIPLLTEIVIIFGLSTAVLLVCHRLRVPSIVGFLVTGIIAGPQGLGLIKAVHEVETLAEFGVVLLLFTIGIEFSLKSLLQSRRTVLLGGSLQVFITVVVVFAISRLYGQSFGVSVFVGFLISISSTAIMLKLLQERGEVDSPHGRTVLGISVFQDVVVVPMMLLTPLLAGKTENIGQSLLFLLGKGIAVIALVIIAARYIVPNVLYQITRTRIRELFLLSIVVICFAVAWLTSSIGLSLALGAFLSGLIISESEYSHQALGNILPFRDVFISFFFISIGMLLDLDFLFKNPLPVTVIALGVLALKTLTAGLASVLLGFPIRTTILVGLILCQVGEFSFILSRTGLQHNLLSVDFYQAFLSVSVLTMASTPFIVALAPRIADVASRLPIPMKLQTGIYPFSGMDISSGKKENLKDHLIVVGFGINGRNLARASRVAGIPYVILEMNPETVRKERANGELIYYGDATQESVLEHAGIKYARVMVVAISDPVATRQIAAIAKQINPKIHIITRTHFVQEVEPLYELGANEVIPEEFETSIEIFTRVLNKYLIPTNEIKKFIAEVRSDSYEMFRNPYMPSPTLSDLTLQLPDIEISALRAREGSEIIGKSLAEIKLRSRYGVTLLAIRRDSSILTNPDRDTEFSANDVLIILGEPEKIAEVAGLLRNKE